jgi:squalene synthase HpnC
MTRAQAIENAPQAEAEKKCPPPVETPSGKGAGDENFPVGSWLIAPKLRGHVAAFYAFARAIDDIADNPALAPGEKLARLDRMDKALIGEDDDPTLATAHACRASLDQCGVTVQHCRDLITAFKGDTTKLRYNDWDDLIAGYCRYSASPVGRYLLDLHGEDMAGYVNSDALCDALQVLNHLQDCKDDYQTLDRVYLPGDWLAAAGTRVEALDAAAASPGLRAVFDQCLDGIDNLLETARALPNRLHSRRLAMESAAIVRIAERLATALRRRDPVAERVELSKPQFLWCILRGVFDVWFGRARRNAA